MAQPTSPSPFIDVECVPERMCVLAMGSCIAATPLLAQKIAQRGVCSNYILNINHIVVIQYVTWLKEVLEL